MPVRTARVCLTAEALPQSSDVRKAARASYWKLVSRLEGLAHFSSHRKAPYLIFILRVPCYLHPPISVFTFPQVHS
jgi:hypothetical protein